MTTTTTTTIFTSAERANAEALTKKNATKTYYPGNGTCAQGLIWNNHKDNKNLSLHDQRDWSKNSIKFYPLNMIPSDFGKPNYLGHQAPLPIGAKGGVTYIDGKSSTAIKWLVAFDCVQNKVFVEVGAVGPTDWNVVQTKLNSSGPASEYEDPISRGKAQAEIHLDNNISVLYVRFF
ncbi:hypothetical protein vseg_020804 [Gypsophila vaccaria]